MAKQPTINLGEQLRKKAHDGLLTGLDEAAFIRADGINLPKEIYRHVKRLFIVAHRGVEKNRNHSRPFDVHTWSDHPEANNFVNPIFDELYGDEVDELGEKSIQKRKKQLKTLLLDLYLAWRDDPTLSLGIARDANAFKAKSRYNELHISKLIREIIDKLIQSDFILQKTGSEISGFQTRLWATSKLIEQFKVVDIPYVSYDNHGDRECIILRDEKRKEIEYDDTDDTNTIREQLRAYNELISRTFIDMPTLEEAFIEMNSEDPDKPSKLYVNQSVAKKFVKRIFNRSSFDFGGRFYGGWWQNCPSYMRDCLLYTSPSPRDRG